MGGHIHSLVSLSIVSPVPTISNSGLVWHFKMYYFSGWLWLQSLAIWRRRRRCVKQNCWHQRLLQSKSRFLSSLFSRLDLGLFPRMGLLHPAGYSQYVHGVHWVVDLWDWNLPRRFVNGPVEIREQPGRPCLQGFSRAMGLNPPFLLIVLDVLGSFNIGLSPCPAVTIFKLSGAFSSAPCPLL